MCSAAKYVILVICPFVWWFGRSFGVVLVPSSRMYVLVFFSVSTQVATFVDSNFVMWVPGGKSPAQRSAAAASAAKRLGARSLPFLGVVNSASVTDKVFLERKLKRSTVGLHHCNPPPSPGQVRQVLPSAGP